MDVFNLARGVIANTFVMLGFLALLAMVRVWQRKGLQVVPAWLMGALFGLLAVVAMMVPVITEPGTIFDCRSGVIGTAALIGGPLTASVSLIPPIIYRLHLGGGGTIPGLMEVLMPALIGTACHLWNRNRRRPLSFRRAAACSAITGFGGNLLIVAFIVATMPQQLTHLGSWGTSMVLLIAPISMAALSSLILLEQQHHAAVASMADSERRMMHSQKMAAVGQLARTLSHSFANSLSAILGNAQEARLQAGDPARVRMCLDSIIASVDKASRLAGEILSLSAPSGSLHRRRMDLGMCVGSLRQMLTETIGKEVALTMNSPPGICFVEMDPERIEQAVVHMAVNAAEAMNGRGRLNISVSAARLSRHERVRLHAGIPETNRHDGDYALISVSDTGCGMTKEALSRLFEPFYTTKEDGTHSGLSLAIVYGIVQQHKGYIDVQSAPGCGSAFSVYLPMADRK